MTHIVTMLLVVLACALVATAARLPPLVGYLAAGFVLAGIGAPPGHTVQEVGNLGVTLLLFVIGLELDVRTLARREVWASTLVHMTAITAVTAGVLFAARGAGLPLLAGAGAAAIWALALALAFSSTVLAVTILDDRSATRAFWGQVVIGVLVFQDIAAVIFVAAETGELPSPWALGVVLLVPLARVARRVWDRLGHGNVEILFALVLAFVPGYLGFEYVGLPGHLGALVVGLLLARHERAKHLAETLEPLKDLLLIAFFVALGTHGLPGWDGLAFALVALALLPLRAVSVYVVTWLTGLRRRTAALTALALANYSEFALIVIVIGADNDFVPDAWVGPLGLTVALSFAACSLVNTWAAAPIVRAVRRLPAHRPDSLHPRDAFIPTQDVDAVVLGLGRVGGGVVERLAGHHRLSVLGFDVDVDAVERAGRPGARTIEGDATDPELWARMQGVDRVPLIVLALPSGDANATVLETLQARGYDGTIASVAFEHEDDVDVARLRGASITHHIYDGAGTALADLGFDEAFGTPDTGVPGTD